MKVPASLKGILKVKGSSLAEIRDGMRKLAGSEVLVGFPEETSKREELEVEGISNAALGYIHDNGQPERNIPARPFMLPGITSVEKRVARILGNGAKAVLRDKSAVAADQHLHQAGLVAATAIKRKLNEGIPPPLSEYTLRQRARRGGKKGGKSAKHELERRAQGLAPSTEFAKPLIDTGAMRNSVTYVIRPRKARK